MSDASWRLHERDHSTPSGSETDARARLLAERLRHGDLSPAALDFAAYCGDPAAQRVSQVRPPDEDDAWLEGLRGWNHATQVCVCYAMALAELQGWRGRRCACSHPEYVHDSFLGGCVHCRCSNFESAADFSVPLAVEALGEWIEEPTEAHARRLRVAADACWEHAPWAAYAAFAARGRPAHDWISTVRCATTSPLAKVRTALRGVAGWWIGLSPECGPSAPPKPLRYPAPSPPRLVFFEDTFAHLEAVLHAGAERAGGLGASLCDYEQHLLCESPAGQQDEAWRLVEPTKLPQRSSPSDDPPWVAHEVGARIFLFATYAAADEEESLEGLEALAQAIRKVVHFVEQISTPSWFTRHTFRDGLGEEAPTPTQGVRGHLLTDPTDPAHMTLEQLLDHFGDV